MIEKIILFIVTQSPRYRQNFSVLISRMDQDVIAFAAKNCRQKKDNDYYSHDKPLISVI